MLKNYLKIAFRNIVRQKGYSFIHIFGLALGIACFLLMALWVQHQMGYDKFHKNAENLYRLEVEIPQPHGKIRGANTPYPLAPAVNGVIPEIKNIARWQSPPRLLIRYDDKQFYEPGIRAVDPSFLKMFSFPFLAGDLETALDDPYSLVLSEDIAIKYFGSEDPMGKTLSVNNRYTFKVTGIMKNFPDNSTLQADILIPFDFPRELGWNYDNWLSCNCLTWIELNAKSPKTAAGKKISDLHHQQILTQSTNFTTEEIQSSTGTNQWNFVLMRLTDINLYENTEFTEGNIQTVRIFIMIGFGILLIACVNYINLSTAKSSKRSKEVGLRKAVGAEKRNIITQFLVETMLMTCLSLIVAVLLVLLLLPIYNNLIDQRFTIISLLQPSFIFVIICIGLFTGIISGCYPALFLSSFHPVKTLKGILRSGKRSAALRKILVVVQFGLSVILLISMITAYKQVQFLLTKDVGYNKEQLIDIPLRGGTQDSYSLLKERLLKHPSVRNVSGINNRPTNIQSNWNDANWKGKDPHYTPEIVYNHVDFGFIETLNIEMVAGRSFSNAYPSDVNHAFIINEEMQKLMGIPSVVGAEFSFLRRTGMIIGVMRNFHHQSVARKIEPLVFLMDMTPYNLVIRLQGGNIPSAIEEVHSIWKQINPQNPFVYTFVDEDFAQMYQSDRQISAIFKYAALLAIIIACIGLLGLAAYLTAERTKEIGVRKVLGSSLWGITWVLSKAFMKWIVISNLIAWPIAYIVMREWLRNYAYRSPLDLSIFLYAGLLTMIMAVGTVSFQVIRAATANPVNALRYE